jgi:hypothetical protein
LKSGRKSGFAVISFDVFFNLFRPYRSIAVMSPSPNTAPWQLAPVSSASRVAAAALVFLALDSTFAWRAIPLAAALAFLIVPLLVAVRVVRGLPNALTAAAATLAGYALLMIVALAAPAGSRLLLVVPAALVVGAILSVAGFAASAIALWTNRRRRPVIEIERTESGSFVAVTSRTPR